MNRSIRTASPLLGLLLCIGLGACSGGESAGDPPVDPPLVGAAVTGATQDRDVDPSGSTLVVEFDGAMDTADVETTGHYTVATGSVLTATQVTPETVRLTLSAPVVPGETSLAVQPGILDATGAASPGAPSQAIASTDEDAPQATRIAGVTVSGLNNDQATIEFDDQMVPADVERLDSWNIESPPGVALNLTGAAVSYDHPSLTATITLGGGQNLATGEEISAVLTTMRDVGGNTIESSAFGAGAVTAFITGDTTPPTLLAVYPGENTNTLRFVFDEQVQFTTTPDLIASQPIFGTDVTFAEASAPGVALQPLASSSILDGLGAEVTFSVAPEAGDAASIAGIADLAGNVIQPVSATSVEARDTSGPELFVGSTELIAVEGERNDIFRMTYDEALHPSGLFNDYSYGLLEGFFVNTLGAKPSWDGDREVSFLLRGPIDHEVQAASTYLLAVAQIMSSQGVPVVGTTYEYTIAATGDSAPPTLTSAKTVAGAPGRLLVEFSEALRVDVATTAANYDLNGAMPTTAVLVSPRVMALTFAQTPGLGDTLTVSSSAIRDRAGNTAVASANVAVQGADTVAPTITSVVATAVDGSDVDLVVAQFSELIDPASVGDGSTITLTVNGSTVSLEAAVLIYQSADNTLTAELPGAIHLPTGQAITLAIASLVDPSGNVSLAEAVNGTVGGDVTAPTALAAFVNYREDTGATVVDVTPNETLRAADTGINAWTASGGQSITAVSARGFDRFRITLSAPLGGTDTLTLTGATDLAGNTTVGTLVVDPTE